MGIKVKNLFQKMKSDKKIVIILIVAVISFLLLVLSEVSTVKSSKESVTESPNNTVDYELQIEDKLEKLISSIDGAGKTKVMVTLSSTQEKIFARQYKNESENRSDNSKKSDEYEYVIVKSGSQEDGLLLKITEPDVKGVAVVCEGADDINVKESIISTISSVLDIKSNKISITKMKSQ